jgi:hypothetical protein
MTYWLINTLGLVMFRDLLRDLLIDYGEGVDWATKTLRQQGKPFWFKRLILPVIGTLHASRESLGRVVFRLDVEVLRRSGQGTGIVLLCPRCRCWQDSRDGQVLCPCCGHPI